ncbi:MAG: hypothetical protein ABIE94_04855 [archaeon]
MPKKYVPDPLRPPRAPNFEKKQKAKRKTPFFPKSKYQPLPGPADKMHSHIAAYAFIGILLCVFLIGVTLNPDSLLSRGAAFSGDPDLDEDHCIFVMENQGLCKYRCYNLIYPQELLKEYDPKCCGDDSMEFVTYFKAYSHGDDKMNEFSIGREDDTSDIACCQKTSDCVYESVCYAEGELLDLDGDGVAGEICKQGKWADLDGFEGDCIEQQGMYWAESAERQAFGEYDEAAPSNFECCGDDAGEFRKGGTFCCDKHSDYFDGRWCI